MYSEMRNLILLIALIITFAVAAVWLWRRDEIWLGAGFGLLAIVGAVSVVWAVVMVMMS
jgi:hypothetical protein